MADQQQPPEAIQRTGQISFTLHQGEVCIPLDGMLEIIENLFPTYMVGDIRALRVGDIVEGFRQLADQLETEVPKMAENYRQYKAGAEGNN